MTTEQVPSKERDLSEYLGKDRDELRAIIGERDAEIEQLREARHKNDRVNFETTDDGFRICRGYHHRSADCEWLYYVPRSTPEPGVGPLKLDTDRQVFFYEQDHYYLSNFSAFQVRLVVPDHDFGGERCIDFDTSEIAYHWFKFEADGREYEGDHHVRGLILSARSSHEAFKIAEKWRDHRRPDWDDVKVGIMRDILWAKVGQHEYVYRKLLETGDRELIENSWRDDFWGWGENRDGQNMLGKLWMQIRTELRASAPTKGAG